MSVLLEYKKQIASGTVIAVFGIAIVAVVSSYYFPAAVQASPTYCKVAPSLPPAYVNPPVAGYSYLAVYNTSNGELLSYQSEASCSLGGQMPQGPFISPNYPSCMPNCTLVVATNEAYLNVTSDPLLPHMLANGYSNAFYVNLTSKLLTIKPGVTFSENYRQAYYDGQPITNGTMLPPPSQ